MHGVLPRLHACRPLSLVTGASSGIGAAFARRLIRDGHDLIVVARRHRRLRALARRAAAADARCQVVAADLATPAGLARVEALLPARPGLRTLVHAAGFGTRELFAELPVERTDAMLHLHVRAPTRLIRAAIPGMVGAVRDSGTPGAVIVVSSLGAYVTGPRYATYSATKAFQNLLCEALAEELSPRGIAVQALCPGLTRTEFFYSEGYRGHDYRQAPPSAWMTPEQVVEASLGALSSGRTVVVPGAGNQVFAALMQTPLAGRLVRRLLGALGVS